jgi:RNA polymerase sigma-70 factor (ECF subfamily)
MAWIAERRRRSRFESVVLPHLDAAYALARWLTRNDADAADVVQEAVLRAYRYFDTYREGDAKSWLLRIVRRTCYSWLERNRPADVVPLEDEARLDDAAEGVPQAAGNAEALLQSRSDLRRLDVLVEGCRRRCEVIVLLTARTGYRGSPRSPAPIGAVMSRPIVRARHCVGPGTERTLVMR